jgi:hypothetical protein
MKVYQTTQRDGDTHHPTSVSVVKVILTGGLITVMLVAFQRTLSTIYVVNFTGTGPNVTALLIGLLVTGWTIPFVPSLWSDTRHVTAAFVGLGGCVVVSMVEVPLVAHLGAVGTMTVGTPLLIGLSQSLRDRIAVSCALGTALFLTIRSWLDTLPTYATVGGRTILFALVCALLALWVGHIRADLPDSPSVFS